MHCAFRLEDGRCNGKYKGFACIGAKCRGEKEMPCPFYDHNYYCRKFRRFGCVGRSRCGETVEEYLRVMDMDRAKA